MIILHAAKGCFCPPQSNQHFLNKQRWKTNLQCFAMVSLAATVVTRFAWASEKIFSQVALVEKSLLTPPHSHAQRSTAHCRLQKGRLSQKPPKKGAKFACACRPPLSDWVSLSDQAGVTDPTEQNWPLLLHHRLSPKLRPLTAATGAGAANNPDADSSARSSAIFRKFCVFLEIYLKKCVSEYFTNISKISHKERSDRALSLSPTLLATTSNHFWFELNFWE